MTEGERGRNGEEEEEELDHWWRPGLSGSWRPAWPKTLVFWAEWHHFICSGKKRWFSRLNLDTGAGGGDFCRLLSTLVGSGIPDNALLIAFSSSTLVKMFNEHEHCSWWYWWRWGLGSVESSLAFMMIGTWKIQQGSLTESLVGDLLPARFVSPGVIKMEMMTLSDGNGNYNKNNDMIIGPSKMP